nr:unnamed protein product [Callosobruchus chinensis]
MIRLIVGLILNVLCLAECYKILVIFPSPIVSHYILGEALASGLAEAGHDVTMVSPFQIKNLPKNGSYREVVLTGASRDQERHKTVREILKQPKFQKLMHSGEKFDAMVIEQFLNDGLKPLAVNALVGNPSPASYIPDYTLNYPIEMSLFQRTWNLVIKMAAYVNQHLLFYPKQQKIAEELIPNALDFDSALYNVSLVLCNSHESVNQPVPMVPNMVHIGGYHIKPPKKLSQEFQEFMDSSPEGVVYFSLGSSIKPSTMDEDKKKAILRALGKLKQKVLWKWDEDNIPDKPTNIKLAKWLPQQDLLAHPNVKLFVTHGGLLSTLETIYHGVPVLALPIFADQKLNAARTQEAGYGKYILFSEITEKKLDDALKILLNEPKYKENAKTRSAVFHDRPMKPIDMATYWIEYVIRHKGAEHLRVAGAKLPWYQYFSLDSIALIILVMISVMILWLTTTVLAYNLLCFAHCYNILLIFPTSYPSHNILGETLAKGLAEAGHDVTMVSLFKTKNPPKNGTLREVLLTESGDNNEDEALNFFEMENVMVLDDILINNLIGRQLAMKALQHPNMQKLIRSNRKFDAVVIEQFLNEALKPLAAHFKGHQIIFNTIGPNMWINEFVGSPSPSSYIPDWSHDYPIEMNLFQRTWNLVVQTLFYVNNHLIFYPEQKKIAEELIPKGFDFYNVLYNVSLILCNTHESVSQAIPLVPNIVNVGGYHIKPPNKLPQELQEFMDSAKEGVVYFSMGSILQPSMMKDDKKMAILNAFGKLKQKVLWKWDKVTIPGKPANVKLAKWFPQQDLLAHPNMKLFVTHGGILSTLETIYHGVPVLALPLFADQKSNAARAEEAGYGKYILFSKITEDNLDDALRMLLNDPKYLQRAKKRSTFFQDRPLKPMDLALYWIEYVIRHDGAEHLRVAGVKLPWYQYFSLDSVALVVLVILSPYFLLKLILTTLLIALILNLLCFAQCYKILVIFPMAAPSHYILGEAIARGLVEAGHDVTMVTSFAMKNTPKNGKYRDVLLTGFAEEHKNQVTMNLFKMETMSMLTHTVAMNFIGNDYTRKTLKHPAMQKLIQSGEKFDAMVIEQFVNEGMKPLAAHFNAHLILFSTIGPNMWVDGFVGNPSPPSYIPDWSVDYPIEMNLFQRTWNLIIKTTLYVNNHLIFYPGQKKIAEEYIPKGYDYDSVLYNVSLVLCNSHESTNQAVPMVSNMIHVGGFHIKPSKKLPQEFQEFMDSAKEGVVYFSLGSNIKPSMMGEDKKMAILKSLGKLKQKVLWKWDEDTIPGKPTNVKLAKWFPQQDLLGRYGENAKRRSSFFHDRPIKPMDLAIYWIEYVIRHKGAEHLRVAGAKLPWYQYYSLDSIGLLTLVALSPYFLLKFLLSLRGGKVKAKKD